jgi:quercetin dioxygenase-like cupin family protein
VSDQASGEEQEEEMTSTQASTVGARRAFHRPGNTGVVYWGPGDCGAFLATGADTNGAYFQADVTVLPGGGPPPHIHHREDETFYIVEGSLEIHLGDVTAVGRPGDYVNVPRGTVHAFRNVGEHPARMLITFVPAGMEHFFAEVYQRADRTAPPPAPAADLLVRLMKAAPRYGLEVLPLPESGA